MGTVQKEHFFTVNGIEDVGEKHAELLSVIGSATYKSLSSLIVPNTSEDEDYSPQEGTGE